MSDMKILAVDDDPAFLLRLQHMLGRLGYAEVQVAGSAAEALRRLRRGSAYDCILLDLDLPAIDGVSLCRRIRVLPEYAATPVILIASLDGQPAIEAAFAAGATDYVTRPLDELELRARLGMVARLIEERRHRSELVDRLQSRPGVVPLLRFDEPVAVTDVPGIVDYRTLENYVLALGRNKLHGHAAIAFRIGNAADIFSVADAYAYADVLTHVGSVIADMLKTREFLMAHAGRGEFVCIIARNLPVAGHVLAQDIAVRLADRSRIYVQLGVPRPVLQVGEPMTIGFFSRTSPVSLLDRALEALRQAVARHDMRAAVVV